MWDQSRTLPIRKPHRRRQTMRRPATTDELDRDQCKQKSYRSQRAYWQAARPAQTMADCGRLIPMTLKECREYYSLEPTRDVAVQSTVARRVVHVIPTHRPRLQSQLVQLAECAPGEVLASMWQRRQRREQCTKLLLQQDQSSQMEGAPPRRL